MSDAEYPDTAAGDQASLAGYDDRQTSLDDTDDEDECLCDLVGDDRLGCFEHYEVTDS